VHPKHGTVNKTKCITQITVPQHVTTEPVSKSNEKKLYHSFSES